MEVVSLIKINFFRYGLYVCTYIGSMHTHSMMNRVDKVPSFVPIQNTSVRLEIRYSWIFREIPNTFRALMSRFGLLANFRCSLLRLKCSKLFGESRYSLLCYIMTAKSSIALFWKKKLKIKKAIQNIKHYFLL